MFQEIFRKRARGLTFLELSLFGSMLSFVLIGFVLVVTPQSDDTVVIEASSDTSVVDVLPSSPSEESSGANFFYGQ